MRNSLLAFLIILTSITCFAGNVTGVIEYSNGVTIKGGTVTFAPSQLGYKTGSFVQVASSVSCYTDANGAVVGLPNPQVLPLVSAGAGGSLSGTVYIKTTYWNASGETAASSEQSLIMGANTRLTVTAPVLQPASATGYKVYVSSSTGAEQLQATITGWGNATVNSVSAGAAAPSANTSICQLTFNDSIIPSYTTYFTTVKDSNGNTLAGYPQNYYFTGSTVDLSNMTPSGNLAVKFPTSALLNPPGNAPQVFNGAISSTGDTSGNTVSANVADGVTSPVNINSNQQNIVIPNLMVGRLGTTIQVNGVPSTYSIPNLSGSGWGFLIGTSGNNLDCTQSNLICTYAEKVFWEAGHCVSNSASLSWDTFAGPDAPTAVCYNGGSFVRGFAKYKANVNLEQLANGNNGAGAGTVTVSPLTLAVGDLEVAVVAIAGNATITGCTDGTNVYTLAKRQANGTSTGVEVWYKQNATAVSGVTLTCTASGSSVMALQWSDYFQAAAVALDATNGNFGSVAGLDPSTVTTTQNSDLVLSAFAILAAAPTVTPGAGNESHGLSSASTVTAFTQDTNMLTTGANHPTATLAAGATWAGAVVGFKALNTVPHTVNMERTFLLPSDWNGGPISVRVAWLANVGAAVTSSTLTWGAQTGCAGDGQVDDASGFNNASAISAPVNVVGVNTLQITPISSVPMTNCTAGQLVHLNIFRNLLNDIYPNIVLLNSVEVTYTRAQ